MRNAFAALLFVAMLFWVLSLGAVVAARQHDGRPIWTTAVYAVASRICHQRPERSFFTGGVQWPVCGRCSGLYVAGPIGGAIALFGRRPRLEAAGARGLVLIAGLPTLVAFALEFAGIAQFSNVTRALAALPLGAAIGWILTRVVQD